MVNHRVARADLGVVRLGRGPGPDLVSDAVAAVPDRDGPAPAGGRPVGSCAVEGCGVVDHQIAGHGVEANQARVVEADGGDRLTPSARKGLIVYEPVGAVDHARPV